MNIQCFGPLSEDAICKLESALGVTLPFPETIESF